jgi:hypothetical protein
METTHLITSSFSGKRKSVVPLRGKTTPQPILGEAAKGKNSSNSIFVFQKETKSVGPLRTPHPTLGEADPGGYGGRAPQKLTYESLIDSIGSFFFQKKKQKA